MTSLTTILHSIEISVALAGGAVIVWGVLSSFVEFIGLEIQHLKGVNICEPREYLRHHLGSYLLLGLEILIAADVMRTILRPSIQELIILGSIVAIRSILDFFLTRSIQNHHCSSEHKGSRE